MGHGAGEDLPRGPRDGLPCRGGESVAGGARVDRGPVENLGGVDVADAGHRFLVEEGDLYPPS